MGKEMAKTKLYDFKVECQETPLGLDIAAPRFSWKLKSDRAGALQSAYRLLVKAGEETVWDTGKVMSQESTEIFYAGKELLPCTRYDAELFTFDDLNEEAYAQTWFETGLFNPSLDAWEGASFIGPTRYSMCASVRGLFAIETTMTIAQGSKRGGVVFGADDERLLDSRMNDFGLEGENYIRYEMDVTQDPARICIYRVGYAKEDREDVPFVSFPALDYETKEAVVTKENAHSPHVIRIEVSGDCAGLYIDGHLVDATERVEFTGAKVRAPRQLNPRGNNDCITYPRLNGIGFFAGSGDTVYFDRLVVKNLRTPEAVVVDETPAGGLYGEAGIFENASGASQVHTIGSGTLRKENGQFKLVGDAGVGGMQISAFPSPVSIPMLRTEFTVSQDKKIAKARLYATARGIYECLINGNKLTDTWFDPGCSQFDKHLMYQTYDVTDKLLAGSNAIGVTLASGWWSDSQTYVLRNYNLYGDKESFLGKLVVTYEDGSRDVVVTSPEKWKYFGKGSYTYAGFFQGERLDGTRLDLYEAFSRPGFDAEGWESPQVITPVPIKGFDDVPMPALATWPDVNEGEPQIVGSYQAPVKEYVRVRAKSMSEPREGLYVFDLGQEMAGVAEIHLDEEEGTVVTIRYGEMLYPELEEYGEMSGMMLLENYRDASSTDIYICRGTKGGEVYRPKFTSHGFRYIEISGTKKAPALDEVIGIQLSSITRITGTFDSSSALLNRFVENVRWSQLCNFISIPTDCPQRNERMGWAGDTHVFTGTANRNADLRLFYYRNLEGFCDLQKDGRFPEIAPTGGGFGGITYESAPLYITWELYLAYGDAAIVKKMYPSLCDFMEYITQAGMPGTAFVGPLGDWLAPQETDLSLLWNAFYGRDCLLMKKMAKIAGDAQGEKHFEALYEEALAYWNDTFLDPKTLQTVSASGEPVDTQCSYALPLIYGLIPENKKEAIGEHLARKVRENGNRISTGFFGTGLINEALTITGHTDLAFSLMLQEEYPSWLYPVTQGATTIWERWNSYTVENGFGGNNAMNSFNHYSLGSVVSWLYRRVLGICEDEENPGYRHILLTPHAMALSHAKGSIQTPHGIVCSGWKREEKEEKTVISYSFVIPVGSTATLQIEEDDLPGGRKLALMQGGEPVIVSPVCENKNHWEAKLNAGSWELVSTQK